MILQTRATAGPLSLLRPLLFLLLASLCSTALAWYEESSRMLRAPAPSSSPSALLTFDSSPYETLFHNLHKRQSDDQQKSIVDLASTDPIAAATQADNLPNVKGNNQGADQARAGNLVQGDGDQNQFPWNQNVYFFPSAATNGSDEGGWQALPEVVGFTLNRTLAIPNRFRNETAIMPFYISQENPANVKRAIIVWPGKPRDTWKYANLMRNAKQVAITNQPQLGVTNDSVLILAPAFLNQADLAAGGARPGEIVFHKSSWQRGGYSKNPKLQHPISSYTVIDFFTDMLFNKTLYPSLNQVVIAGHSMGGQATQRYALLKKTKPYDPNMRYWIGNPGSWAWLTEARPFSNGSCSSNNAFDTWPYGLGGNQSAITNYARRDVNASKEEVIARYLKRNVGYALALLDLGPGDTHCQAQWQGGNHLDRGANFVMQFSNKSLGSGTFPAAHTADFVANVSHQDYPMYSANSSLARLFGDGLNVRNPLLVNVTNPGDRPKKPPALKGIKVFATPAHEKLAVVLLSGSFAFLILIFTMLPFIFTANGVDFTEKADSRSYMSFESNQHLIRKH